MGYWIVTGLLCIILGLVFRMNLVLTFEWAAFIVFGHRKEWKISLALILFTISLQNRRKFFGSFIMNPLLKVIMFLQSNIRIKRNPVPIYGFYNLFYHQIRPFPEDDTAKFPYLFYNSILIRFWIQFWHQLTSHRRNQQAQIPFFPIFNACKVCFQVLYRNRLLKAPRVLQMQLWDLIISWQSAKKVEFYPPEWDLLSFPHRIPVQ